MIKLSVWITSFRGTSTYTKVQNEEYKTQKYKNILKTKNECVACYSYYFIFYNCHQKIFKEQYDGRPSQPCPRHCSIRGLATSLNTWPGHPACETWSSLIHKNKSTRLYQSRQENLKQTKICGMVKILNKSTICQFVLGYDSTPCLKTLRLCFIGDFWLLYHEKIVYWFQSL